MVLARELHEKIKNIQIKVESSKRLFSIEEELEGTKDAIHLLTAKFEKLNQALSSNAEPDDQLQKIKKILILRFLLYIYVYNNYLIGLK